MPNHHDEIDAGAANGTLITLLERITALETTMQYQAQQIDRNAERENAHHHEVSEENRRQETRIRTLEDRHDVRFQTLEHKVFMGIGALVAAQFIIGLILALFHLK